MQIQLNRTFPSGGWETIIASTPNDGSYAWTVSGAATSMARVRVTSVETPAATDVSNSEFSITPPVVTVIDPNGGETWVSGTVDTISWMITGTPGTVVVQLNRTYPSANWETIATTSNTSTPITVTGGVSNTVRVRVYLQSTPTVGDSSNSNFSIAVPTVTVLSPNGGETLTPGQPTALRWSSTNMSGTRTVELNRSYSGGQWEVLSSTVTADSLVWTPDQFGGIAARIRVTSNSFPTISDVSNADFTILTPSLAVVSPNGGESLTSGNAYTLRWSRSNLFGLVNVYYNLAHPSGQWLPVQLNVASDTLQWTVPSAVSGAARIRVSSVNVPTLSDESNGNFSIGSGIT